MLRFEWDIVRGRNSQRKHRIGFDDAMHVFADPRALFGTGPRDEAGQQRGRALGMAGGVLVVIEHTVREDGRTIQLHSARRATREEQERYEQVCAQNAG